jgi:hypothetical protein
MPFLEIYLPEILQPKYGPCHGCQGLGKAAATGACSAHSCLNNQSTHSIKNQSIILCKSQQSQHTTYQGQVQIGRGSWALFPRCRTLIIYNLGSHFEERVRRGSENVDSHWRTPSNSTPHDDRASDTDFHLNFRANQLYPRWTMCCRKRDS